MSKIYRCGCIAWISAFKMEDIEMANRDIKKEVKKKKKTDQKPQVSPSAPREPVTQPEVIKKRKAADTF